MTLAGISRSILNAYLLMLVGLCAPSANAQSSEAPQHCLSSESSPLRKKLAEIIRDLSTRRRHIWPS